MCSNQLSYWPKDPHEISLVGPDTRWLYSHQTVAGKGYVDGALSRERRLSIIVQAAIRIRGQLYKAIPNAQPRPDDIRIAP